MRSNERTKKKKKAEFYYIRFANANVNWQRVFSCIFADGSVSIYVNDLFSTHATTIDVEKRPNENGDKYLLRLIAENCEYFKTFVFRLFTPKTESD